MRRFIILSSFLFLVSAGAQGLAASPTPVEPDPFALPLTPILDITKKTNIRVVYDVKDDVWDAGIGTGLYYVRAISQGGSVKPV